MRVVTRAPKRRFCSISRQNLRISRPTAAGAYNCHRRRAASECSRIRTSSAVARLARRRQARERPDEARARRGKYISIARRSFLPRPHAGAAPQQTRRAATHAENARARENPAARPERARRRPRNQDQHQQRCSAAARAKIIYARALYDDGDATLDDLREAVTTLEDTYRIARRVLGNAHPITEISEHSLEEAGLTLARALA